MRNVLTLTICAVLAAMGGNHSASAEEGSAIEAQPAVLLQGEAMTLPRDYVAALDGDTFRLQLEDLGGSEVANQMVSLLDARGGVQRRTSNQSGVVEFQNVAPGLNSVAVTGQGVHAAAAVYVTPGDSEAGAGDVRGRGNFRLPVISIDGSTVLRHVRCYLPEQRHYAAPMAEFAPPAANQITGETNYRITLGPDGTLNGMLSVPGASASGTGMEVNILLYQRGRLVAQTVSRGDGTFSFTGLAPGLYGLIAIGQAGYGAIAFEAVAAEELPAMRAASFSMVQGGTSTLVVPMIPPSMFPQLLNAIESAYGGTPPGTPPGPPLAGGPFGPPGGGFGGGFGPGGGFGGGVGGGGAGAGGGGGLGGLGALAALGAIGAAIAGNNDDDRRPQAASPRFPNNPPFGLPPGPPAGVPPGPPGDDDDD